MASKDRPRRGTRRHRPLVRRRGLALKALSALDRWTLAYAALATVATLARWPPHAAPPLPVLGAHAALFGCALLASRARERGPAARFVGEFYPLFALVALYTSIGLVNTAARVSHDATVQAWEQAVFGGQPAREWIRAWPRPWLSVVLHGGYLSYYLILAAAPLGLWFTGRRAGARRTALLIMVAFYTCYTVFLLFPVAGPRYAFPPARNAATAVAPAVLTQRLLDQAAAWGTAFPSSHVAAALVASVSAWQTWRPLGAVLLPLAVLLSAGTVYGQLHYAVDAVAGALLAALVLALHPAPRGSD
jgi:membrane-associated phospholipid phosphatase